jgi:hypothetical protein
MTAFWRMLAHYNEWRSERLMRRVKRHERWAAGCRRRAGEDLRYGTLAHLRGKPSETASG